MTWKPPASTSLATAARPASATPARCPTTSPKRSTGPGWSARRCCPATATSKAASPPTSRRTTWLRLRWSWPMPWRARSIGIPFSSRSPVPESTCATYGQARRRSPGSSGRTSPGASSPASTPMCSRDPMSGATSAPRRARSTSGTRRRPTSKSRPSSRVLGRT